MPGRLTRRRLAEIFATGGSAALLACGVRWPTREPLPPTPDEPTEEFWERVRAQFLMPRDLAVMNAANMCPSPRPVLEAAYSMTEDVDRDPSFHNRAKLRDGKEHTRRLLADYLRVTPEEVVIVRNTSEGNNLVSSGLDLGPADEVVVFSDNHPSNNAAWKDKAKRFGFGVREVPAVSPHPGTEHYVDAFRASITARTKVLAFTHATNTVGDLLPAREICQLARERGVLTLVDGAQTFGVLDLDLRAMQPDFFTGSSHKWPCGPREVGVLYVHPDARERIWPSVVSLYGGATGAAAKLEHFGQRDDAAILAFGAAVRFMSGLGRDKVEARARELTRALVDGLRRIDGVTLWTHPSPSRSASIVSFRPGDLDGRALYAALYENDRIGAAPRSGSRPGLRLAPHVYNLRSEIDRALEAIARYVKRGI